MVQDRQPHGEGKLSVQRKRRETLASDIAQKLLQCLDLDYVEATGSLFPRKCNLRRRSAKKFRFLKAHTGRVFTKRLSQDITRQVALGLPFRIPVDPKGGLEEHCRAQALLLQKLAKRCKRAFSEKMDAVETQPYDTSGIAEAIHEAPEQAVVEDEDESIEGTLVDESEAEACAPADAGWENAEDPNYIGEWTYDEEVYEDEWVNACTHPAVAEEEEAPFTETYVAEEYEVDWDDMYYCDGLWWSKTHQEWGYDPDAKQWTMVVDEAANAPCEAEPCEQVDCHTDSTLNMVEEIVWWLSNRSAEEPASKRRKVQKMLADLSKKYPYVGGKDGLSADVDLEVDGSEESYHEWIKQYRKQNSLWRASANGYLKCKGQKDGETITTPSPRLLVVPEHTPEPVARPYSKVALAASKRMEAQMKQTSSQANQLNKPGSKSVTETKAKKPESKPHAVKEKQKPLSLEPQPKKKKDLTTGPLYNAFQTYMAAQKEQGMSHKEALQSWMSSMEREKLLFGMSEAELKRRRFTS
ncbi:unnamed protein product [Durusdinium trenchii]|uniref:Uncharacterized protein n=1 Tax=Durusdinium trenchii TaxID=1381693 RepID=A0ABP0IXM2_9DINO